jgi:hypothetical protein
MSGIVAFMFVLVAEVEDAATEGKKIITAMLITGLVFIAVVFLGQTAKWLGHRRQAAKARRASQY